MGLLKYSPFAGLLLLSSCWTPVFDADVALAAVTAGKLGKPDIEFEAQSSWGNDVETILAVPSRENPSNQVTIVALDSMHLYATGYQRSDGTWGTNSTQYGTTFDSALPEPDAVVLGTGYFSGSTGASVVLASLPTSNSGSLRGFSTDYSLEGSYPIDLSYLDHVVGVSVPYPDATYNYAYAGVLDSNGSIVAINHMGFSGATGDYDNVTELAHASYDGFPTGWLATPNTNPVTVTFPFGFYTTTFSKDSSGNYTTTQWAFLSAGTTTLTKVKSWSRPDHVVALLTTGELLTREGGFYNVCGIDGTIRYSFPGGRLSFAGEFTDASGTTRCWFTVVLSGGKGDNGSGVTVRVYSIPTAKLSSLK